MTPPQFTIQDGYLKELPRMKWPQYPESLKGIVIIGVYPEKTFYKEKLEEYKKHIDGLRSYRLANPSDWDNVPMPIGEDGFEVERIGGFDSSENAHRDEEVAVPLRKFNENWVEEIYAKSFKTTHEAVRWIRLNVVNPLRYPTQPAKGQLFNVTREQLEELWDAAIKWDYEFQGKEVDDSDYVNADKETYINQLLTPKQ